MKALIKARLNAWLEAIEVATYPRRYILALRLFPEFRWIISDTTKAAYARGCEDTVRRIQTERAYASFQDAQKKTKLNKTKTNK